MSNRTPVKVFAEKLRWIRTTKLYLIIYLFLYSFLAVNQQLVLLFFPKSVDIVFTVFTLLLSVFYFIDIVCRSFSEQNYFFRFFFFIDATSMILGALVAVSNTISLFVTIGFVKLIMISRMANVIVAIRELRR